MTAAIHLVAGLNGSGKTTLARNLEMSLPGVRFSLDEWMLRLYGLPFNDPRYPDLAERCQDLIWILAAQVLNAGIDVILDWNMWSRERRADAVRRARKMGVRAHLHHVVVPLSVAVAQAAARDDPGSHRLSAEGIAHLSDLFEEPRGDEGFTLHVIEPSAQQETTAT